MIPRNVNTTLRTLGAGQPVTVASLALAERRVLVSLWAELTGQRAPWYWPRLLLALAIFSAAGELAFRAYPDEAYDETLRKLHGELEQTRVELEVVKAKAEAAEDLARERAEATWGANAERAS